MMNRRDFLKAICVGAAGLSCTGEYGAAKSGSSKPNVLFIAIDDMNDWTTLFDPKNPIKTPNLVRLAKRGMFFSKAYCAAPACCPSRAAIMTGIRPGNSGVYDNNHAWAKMMPDRITLSRYFMLNGYETFGAGKIFHHGKTGADIPNKPSFQEFFKMRRTRRMGNNHNGYTEGPLSRVAFDWGEHEEKMIDLDTVESCVKFTLWEKANHVPFIIVAPGVTKPGSRCDRPVSLIDIYPTLVDLTGLPSKKDLDGKSDDYYCQQSKYSWLDIDIGMIHSNLRTLRILFIFCLQALIIR